MDQEMMDMFQLIIKKIDTLDKKIETVDKKVETVDKKVDDGIRGVKIMIENDVSRRIESLFDGYQLVHEKQWVLEKKLEELEKRLERLEVQHSA